MPNNFFPAGIVRVSLPGVYDLKLPRGLRDLPQSVQVAQDQVRSLVPGGPPRKSNREYVGVECQPGLGPHRFQ